MEPFSAWILPLLLSGAALWGARRRVDVYDALVTGGKSGLQVAVSILPALAALLTAVYMLRASGALDALTALLAPVLTALGVPPEPDSGRITSSGAVSGGTPRTVSAGASRAVRASNAPEARSIYTAVSRAANAGRMDTATCRPLFPPVTRAS